LLECLPDEFERKDALQISDQIGMPPATLGRFLETKYFERVGYGKYRKAK